MTRTPKASLSRAYWAVDLPRLWFRGYRSEGRDRLLAGRVGEVLTWESVGWVASEQAAGRLPGEQR